jgi:ubiquinone/menaquinone biosynthesis C-methylase UbiE
MNLQGSSSSDQRRLYGDLAWTWPIISHKENYVGEAEEFYKVIQGHSQIPAKTLLHLGCGGGHLDFTLKKHFEVTGVDVSEAMLSLATRLNPEVAYLVGDMRVARLGKTFDAVIIADSIDYMLTLEDLRAAFVTAFVHLKPGGVFCTYAEVTTESLQQNRTECSTHRQGDIEIVFVENRYDPDPTDTTYENIFVYLIRRGGQLEIETDRHLGGIFKLETWPALLREVGFGVQQMELDEEGIPMFVCIKPL